MDAAISISGLRKSYGTVRALDGLDLEVAAGEVHGYLGPNGAGKTTTIRMAPILVLTVVAGGLIALGLYGLRRRDPATT